MHKNCKRFANEIGGEGVIIMSYFWLYPKLFGGFGKRDFGTGIVGMDGRTRPALEKVVVEEVVSGGRAL